MIRKWFKIHAGKAIAVTSIVALLTFISVMYGFEITGTDDVCAGTIEDPCISYITVKNPNAFVVDVYNQEGFKLGFSPSIKQHYLFRKDGRCKGGSSCAAPNGLSYPGWNFIDFTEATKPRKDKVYVYRFPAYSTKEFMLYGLKNNPSDVIKWGVDVNDYYLDPVWEAPKDLPNVTLEDKQATHIEYWNTTKEIYNYVKYCHQYPINLSWTSCRNFSHIEITQHNETIIDLEWQEIRIKGELFNITSDKQLWCYKDVVRKIICKSKLDGDGRLKIPRLQLGMSYITFDYSGDDIVINPEGHLRKKYEFDFKKIITDKNIVGVKLNGK